MKRIISILLVLCLAIPTVYAEEEEQSVGGSIENWFNHAFEDASTWVSHAAGDVSEWATNAFNDASAWTKQALSDASDWTVQAWNNSSEKVSQAWSDSTEWMQANWDHFILWMNTIIAGDPYAWIEDVVLNNGELAYNEYINIRSFLNENPSKDAMREQYDAIFYDLSMLNEDKETVWTTLESWSDEKGVAVETTSKLALPFLTRLIIEGEAVIGDDAIFSGPVIGQYIITVLEALNFESADDADMELKMLDAELESLTRPTIIGDTDQNILVTEDQYYIENFTYASGKYQIILIASPKDDNSQPPMLRGLSLTETVKKYFKSAECGTLELLSFDNADSSEAVSFQYTADETLVNGKSIAIWTEDRCYLFFAVTDQEWNEEEFATWLNSITLENAESVTLEVDMESDGAFYGINQTAQKYTINRIFDEAKFTAPKGGHGWAAERGNNLIDNIKGFIKGEHSTVVGDNNVKNGADRVTQYADGTTLYIQTKYYSSASRSVAACFDENGFRYLDADGNPMAIEVPSDQYAAAVKYMENKIANGEVPGVTDTSKATEIVKKGNLTFLQAKHIAKAGTIESILYDSAHACVTAATSMGISAAFSFAYSVWNGESWEVSIKESILQGLKTGGTSFIISVLSAQLAKTGLNTALIPASKVVVKALGPKVSAAIVNAFRPAGNAIYGAAAMQSAAKLLRGGVITNAVTFVVLSSVDVAELIQGKISWKQLAKNASKTAAGIVGGYAGYLGGAALGTAIAPGVGTVAGLVIGAAAGWGASEGADAIADMIADDDADEMIQIIEEQFAEIATEYFLNEDEVNQAIENLQSLLTAKMLKEMYQYNDHDLFARQLIEMAIDPVVAKRDYVDLPSEEEYSKYLTDTLEAIYDDLNDESATE